MIIPDFGDLNSNFSNFVKYIKKYFEDKNELLKIIVGMKKIIISPKYEIDE